jgi:N-acetylmuramic acid 6-phosphate etherase
VPHSAIGAAAEIAISPVTGAEVLTGSTRLKAGTATKLVLNMLSTGVMVRIGYVYGNQMVNMQPTNAKLIDRAGRIVAAITGLDRERAGALLSEAGSVKVAVVMSRLGLSRAVAETRLHSVGGNLRKALGES